MIPIVRGPVEALSAAAALLALVLGLVAVGYGIHPRSIFHPAGRVHCVFGCLTLTGQCLHLVDVAHFVVGLQEEGSLEY